jgi:small subunit ribosomal protein S9
MANDDDLDYDPEDDDAVRDERPVAPPRPIRDPQPPKNGWWWGTGRRKTAIASVRVKKGKGAFHVNGRELKDFFRVGRDFEMAIAPFRTTERLKNYDFHARTSGGGTTGQAGAISLAIARALLKCEPELEPAMREHKFLTRDPRMKERKKYGQRSARARFQYSKR